MKIQEFQAIILAGYGQRLYHLVDETPKPLLPVANQPMIWNVLQWLESGGITSILIVSTPESSQKLSHFISKVYETHSGRARIELLTPEAYGTADALRAVADKIKSDFIVTSCDLFTDQPLLSMLNTFRLEGPSILCTFSAIPRFEYVGPGGGGNRDQMDHENLFVGLDQQNKRLISLDSLDLADLDADEGDNSVISVHQPLLNGYGTVNIYSNISDSHIFIMQRWLLDFLCANKDIMSIREDLLPLLVKCQHSRPLRQKWNIEKYLCNNSGGNSNSQNMNLSDLLSAGVQQMMSIKDGQAQLMVTSPLRATNSGQLPCASPENNNNNNNNQAQVRVMTRLFMGNDLQGSGTGNFCVRVNTVPAYFEMNKFKARMTALTLASSVSVAQNSQVGSDSLVGDGTKIGERCSVKKSVIGQHCQLGRNVKVSNSIIGDYVVIDENVRLDGCIVSAGAQIQSKCNLRDCEVGAKYLVETGVNAKGETFIESRVISADEEGL